MVNIFWRIFWIQHIHCLFSSLCVVVSEFGRNMKFNRKKNHTAELGLPKLTEVVCMQLNILVWTMIDCNYNPHKNTSTFYSNHLSTFKVEQINNQNTFTKAKLPIPWCPHLPDCISAIFPITPHQQHEAQLVEWSAIMMSPCCLLMSANEMTGSLWSDQSEKTLHVCYNMSPPDWVKLFWRPLDGEGVTLHH